MKHPIPLNTSPNSLCILIVVSVLVTLVSFHFWTCNKVVYFLYSFLFVCRSFLMLFFGLDSFVCLLIFFSDTYHLLFGSLCSAGVSIHSQAFIVMLVHFLVQQRNCTRSQCPYQLLRQHIPICDLHELLEAHTFFVYRCLEVM